MELGIPTVKPPSLFSNNIGATYLCANPVFHTRMKHLATNYHLVCDLIAAKELLVSYSIKPPTCRPSNQAFVIQITLFPHGQDWCSLPFHCLVGACWCTHLVCDLRSQPKVVAPTCIICSYLLVLYHIILLLKYRSKMCNL